MELLKSIFCKTLKSITLFTLLLCVVLPIDVLKMSPTITDFVKLILILVTVLLFYGIWLSAERFTEFRKIFFFLAITAYILENSTLYLAGVLLLAAFFTTPKNLEEHLNIKLSLRKQLYASWVRLALIIFPLLHTLLVTVSKCLPSIKLFGGSAFSAFPLLASFLNLLVAALLKMFIIVIVLLLFFEYGFRRGNLYKFFSRITKEGEKLIGLQGVWDAYLGPKVNTFGSDGDHLTLLVVGNKLYAEDKTYLLESVEEDDNIFSLTQHDGDGTICATLKVSTDEKNKEIFEVEFNAVDTENDYVVTTYKKQKDFKRVFVKNTKEVFETDQQVIFKEPLSGFNHEYILREQRPKTYELLKEKKPE